MSEGADLLVEAFVAGTFAGISVATLAVLVRALTSKGGE